MGDNGRKEAASSNREAKPPSGSGVRFLGLRAQSPSRSRNPRQQQAMQENQRRPLRRLAAGWPYFALSSLSLYFRVKKSRPTSGLLLSFLLPLAPRRAHCRALGLRRPPIRKVPVHVLEDLELAGRPLTGTALLVAPPTLKCVLSDE